MQQTQNYKLNLIETSDVFSPVPLNENADAIDVALAQADTRLTTIATDLNSRVTALEVHKMVAGSYEGNNQARTIDLGFTPKALIIQAYVNTAQLLYLVTEKAPLGYHNSVQVEIASNGFTVTAGDFNVNRYIYHFVALA